MTRKLILPAAIVACAIGFGCTTEETSYTMAPYASISDDSREPASSPTPSFNSNSGDSGAMSKTGQALGDVIMWPFRAIGDAFGSK